MIDIKNIDIKINIKNKNISSFKSIGKINKKFTKDLFSAHIIKSNFYNFLKLIHALNFAKQQDDLTNNIFNTYQNVYYQYVNKINKENINILINNQNNFFEYLKSYVSNQKNYFNANLIYENILNKQKLIDYKREEIRELEKENNTLKEVNKKQIIKNSLIENNIQNEKNNIFQLIIPIFKTLAVNKINQSYYFTNQQKNQLKNIINNFVLNNNLLKNASNVYDYYFINKYDNIKAKKYISKTLNLIIKMLTQTLKVQNIFSIFQINSLKKILNDYNFVEKIDNFLFSCFNQTQNYFNKTQVESVFDDIRNKVLLKFSSKYDVDNIREKNIYTLKIENFFSDVYQKYNSYCRAENTKRLYQMRMNLINKTENLLNSDLYNQFIDVYSQSGLVALTERVNIKKYLQNIIKKEMKYFNIEDSSFYINFEKYLKNVISETINEVKNNFSTLKLTNSFNKISLTKIQNYFDAQQLVNFVNKIEFNKFIEEENKIIKNQKISKESIYDFLENYFSSTTNNSYAEFKKNIYEVLKKERYTLTEEYKINFYNEEKNKFIANIKDSVFKALEDGIVVISNKKSENNEINEVIRNKMYELKFVHKKINKLEQEEEEEIRREILNREKRYIERNRKEVEKEIEKQIKRINKNKQLLISEKTNRLKANEKWPEKKEAERRNIEKIINVAEYKKLLVEKIGDNEKTSRLLIRKIVNAKEPQKLIAKKIIGKEENFKLISEKIINIVANKNILINKIIRSITENEIKDIVKEENENILINEIIRNKMYELKFVHKKINKLEQEEEEEIRREILNREKRYIERNRKEVEKEIEKQIKRINKQLLISEKTNSLIANKKLIEEKETERRNIEKIINVAEYENILVEKIVNAKKPQKLIVEKIINKEETSRLIAEKIINVVANENILINKIIRSITENEIKDIVKEENENILINEIIRNKMYELKFVHKKINKLEQEEEEEIRREILNREKRYIERNRKEVEKEIEKQIKRINKNKQLLISEKTNRLKANEKWPEKKEAERRNIEKIINVAEYKKLLVEKIGDNEKTSRLWIGKIVNAKEAQKLIAKKIIGKEENLKLISEKIINVVANKNILINKIIDVSENENLLINKSIFNFYRSDMKHKLNGIKFSKFDLITENYVVNKNLRFFWKEQDNEILLMRKIKSTDEYLAEMISNNSIKIKGGFDGFEFLHLVHKNIEDDGQKASINLPNKFQRNLQTVEITPKRASNVKQVNHSEQVDISTKVMNSNYSKFIKKEVDENITKSINDITDKVYSNIEKRLKSEQRRLGFMY